MGSRHFRARPAVDRGQKKPTVSIRVSVRDGLQQRATSPGRTQASRGLRQRGGADAPSTGGMRRTRSKSGPSPGVAWSAGVAR